MPHTMTIRLPDEVHEHVAQMARKAGQTDEEWIVDRLLAITPQMKFLTPVERAEAKARLMRHAGAVYAPHAAGADNELIDRDLADEYESTHEDDA